MRHNSPNVMWLPSYAIVSRQLHTHTHTISLFFLRSCSLYGNIVENFRLTIDLIFFLLPSGLLNGVTIVIIITSTVLLHAYYYLLVVRGPSKARFLYPRYLVATVGLYTMGCISSLLDDVCVCCILGSLCGHLCLIRLISVVIAWILDTMRILCVPSSPIQLHAVFRILSHCCNTLDSSRMLLERHRHLTLVRRHLCGLRASLVPLLPLRELFPLGSTLDVKPFE